MKNIHKQMIAEADTGEALACELSNELAGLKAAVQTEGRDSLEVDLLISNISKGADQLNDLAVRLNQLLENANKVRKG